MKVLLDEQLPHQLRTYLGAHEVYTVDYMGWAGLKNGELLRAAEAAGFEVFLTGDKNLVYQQNVSGRPMAIITLSAIDFDILKPNLSLDRRCHRQRLAGVVSYGRVRHVQTARPLTL